MEIGLDSTHPVVGGGVDRNGVMGPVEVAGAGCRVDRGEAAGEEVGRLCRNIEEDRKSFLLSHLAGNAASDYVARGQLGGGVEELHEAAAVGIEEEGAFSADGLGDEESA